MVGAMEAELSRALPKNSRPESTGIVDAAEDGLTGAALLAAAEEPERDFAQDVAAWRASGARSGKTVIVRGTPSTTEAGGVSMQRSQH